MATIRGTNRGETLVGTLNSDTILGLGGDDIISGDAPLSVFTPQGPADSIDGGAGNDSLNGQGGNDTVRGGRGYDFLGQSAGADLTDGGAGNDTLVFNGTDTVIRGKGFDTFVVGAFLDILGVPTQAVLSDRTAGERIDLGRFLDANALVAGDQAFTFLGNFGSAPLLAAGQVAAFQRGADTIIRGFDGVNIFEVELDQTAVTLTANDFIL